jgi:hypothetical protein
MYDRRGNVTEAQKLKGRACAIWTDLVSEVSRSGVKANQVIKRLEAGVTIEYRYWTDAYEQVNGTAIIFVPGGQVVEQDCGGFLGIKTGYPANVYYFPTTTSDFKTIVPNTDLKGSTEYWHGKKETVSWHPTIPFTSPQQYVYIKAVKYKLSVMPVYAFIKGNYLIVIALGTYLGVHSFNVGSLNPVVGMSEPINSPLHSNINAFNSLSTLKSIGVDAAANKLALICRNASSVNSGFPGGWVVPGGGVTTTFPFSSSSGGYSLILDSIKRLNIPTWTNSSVNWDTVLEYDIIDISIDNIAANDYLTLTLTQQQFIKHIYEEIEAYSYSVSNNYSPLLGVINTATYSMTATIETTFNVIYNTAFKTFVRLRNGILSYETYSSSIVGGSTHTTTASYNYTSGSTGSIPEPAPWSEVSTSATNIAVNADIKVTVYTGDCKEELHGIQTQTGTQTSSGTINYDVWSNPTSTAGAWLSSVTYNNTENEQAVKYLSGVNPYIDDYSVVYDVFDIDGTKEGYYKSDSRVFLNSHAIYAPAMPAATVTFGTLGGGNIGINSALQDVLSQYVRTVYDLDIPDFSIYTAADIIGTWFLYPIGVIINDSDSYTLPRRYFMLAPNKTGATYYNNKVGALVRNDADKCGNMMYTLNTTGWGTAAVEKGAKALKKDFSLSAKQAEIDAILEIPADMIGVV